ncbi:MAG: hypothetical protein JXJ17_16795 [Anaerolineae bacterium]|nr:hypothetical protein [Anaerolineae bacterium]
MSDYPDDPNQKDEKPFEVSPSARSLLNRLNKEKFEPERPAPEPEPEPPPPSEPEPPSEPLPSVSPFTIEDLSAIDLSDLGPERADQLPENPGKALARLQEKMAQVTEDLATGKINQAQFEALFTRFSEQHAVIMRLMDRNPESDAWQRVAGEGHTDFLLRQHQAKIEGILIVDNWSGRAIRTLGSFVLGKDILASLIKSLEHSQKLPDGEKVRYTQIEGGRWLCSVTDVYTTTIAIFTTEPTALQLDQLSETHREFERLNKHALEMGQVQPEYLHFPHEALFGQK